ncbi:MAG: glycosyltransferase family 39 protein [Bacteroidales bacterium]
MLKLIGKYRYELLFAGILIIYLINMFLDVMEVDAAQYANISMEMSYNKSFLQVFFRGEDYLDKPPLLFWMSSLSFLLFGISNFAYKLPSVLILLLGIYSTYRFAKLWYDKKTGMHAALILASSQAFFLITNDVRTDTALVGLVIFSVWQISLYIRKGNWINLILAAFGTGGAMLAKGPIGLVIPAVAIGTDLILKRDWKTIYKYQWLIFLGIVAVILLPMSYGLFMQFDLHPEKFVYNLQGPSGLRFYYWTQSFGRITGENYWDNDAPFFFFFHTILWDFQPWVLFFIPAIGVGIYRLINNRFKVDQNNEIINLSGFILILLALSLSKFKLPHYIFPIFPFAAIITASYIINLAENTFIKFGKVIFGILQLEWVAAALIFVFVFPPHNFLIPSIGICLLGLTWWIFLKQHGKDRIIVPILITAIGFNFIMSMHFYPNLLEYQGTAKAGKLFREQKNPEDELYVMLFWENAIDFYARKNTKTLERDQLAGMPTGSWLFTNQQGHDEINQFQLPLKQIAVFDYYKVSALKLKFLNKNTRDMTLRKVYLFERE